MAVNLNALADNLWVLDQDFKMMGANIGVRTTVVRLSDGSLWVHAPGPEIAGAYKSLCALGTVRHLVAPNAFHHLYVPKAATLFPEATVWGPGALKKKQPGLSFQALGKELPEAWMDDFEVLHLAGLKLQEYAFFHHASKTLIVTDLVFNLQNPDFTTRLLTRLMGTHKGLACSRLISTLMLRDKKVLQKTLETIYSWDFERVLMAHGAVLDTDAKARLQKAMAWVET